VKEPTKPEVQNHKRKSIQTHKRNIQCQKISWNHWDGCILLYFNIKYHQGRRQTVSFGGGHWRGQFCNKGSCQWSVYDFNAVAWRHAENFGGARQNFGGAVAPPGTPLAPPLSITTPSVLSIVQ